MRRSALVVCLLMVASCGDSEGGPVSSSAPLGGQPPGTHLWELQTGDCFNDPDSFTELETLETIECTEPHHNEVYAVAGYADSDRWPGDQAMEGAAFDICLEAVEPFLGGSYDSSQWDTFAFWPSRESWEEGVRRQIVCVIHDFSGAKVTGSAQGSGE